MLHRPSSAFAVLPFVLVAEALAQCQPQWQPGLGLPATDGTVAACEAWDPDGAGPMVRRAVFGGTFTLAGSLVCPGLVLVDTLSGALTTVPTGMVDQVTDLAIGPANELLVAGSRPLGSGREHVVARWSGTAWTQLGPAFDAPVLVLCTLGSGEVAAGGSFQTIGGAAVACLAKWNGTAWSALGGGVTGPAARVETLVLDSGSTVVVGGRFTAAGPLATNNIAAWDGSAWSAFGAGLASEVTSVAVVPQGGLYAAGPGMAVPRVWQFGNWSTLPGLQAPSSGVQEVTELAVVAYPFGAPNLLVMGRFSLPQLPDVNVAFSDLNGSWFNYYGGLQLAPSVTGAPRFDVLAFDFDNLFLAGDFIRLAGRDGAAGYRSPPVYGWRGIGNGIGRAVEAVGTLANGDLLIGGTFASIGDDPIAGLAHRDGSAWRPLGGGIGSAAIGLDAAVFATANAPDGSTILGGQFSSVGSPVVPAGGVQAYNIARFDGASWSGFGTGLPVTGVVRSLLPRSGGVVFVGSEAGLARWNGSSWSVLTGVAAGLGGQVMTLAALGNGDIVVGGYLQQIPGGATPGVVRWTGSAFQPLGAGLGSVLPGTSFAVFGSCVRPDGTLFVTGQAGFAPFVARWNGTTWSLLPSPSSGEVLAAGVLPDGDVVVGGQFAAIGGVPAMSLARWNGQTWSPLGSGAQRLDGSPGTVLSLAWSRAGELLVGGSFDRAGGQLAVNFARLQPSCPATVVPFGLGCAGSGGLDVLTADNQPWLGATFRSTATGLPGGGLALDVRGFGPAFVPLAAVLPVGVAGCTLWTTPDLLTVLVPTAGTATTQVAIPASLPLVGQVLHQQIVGLEFGVGGSLTGLTSSNRLTLTLGSF